MTGARELIEEGTTQGFAIIAMGHALLAAEQMEPVAAIQARSGTVRTHCYTASALYCCVSSARLAFLLRVAFL